MRRRRFIFGVTLLTLAAVAAGVFLLAIPAFIQTPDSVHVVVTQVQPPPQPPGGGPSLAGPIKTTTIFDARFTHQATMLYQDMVSSGAYGGTGSSCPISATGQPYYHYALTFFHRGVQVAAAVSDAIDCQDIAVEYLGGNVQLFSSMYDGHSFWIQLHRLTGAPEPIGICMTIPECHS